MLFVTVYNKLSSRTLPVDSAITVFLQSAFGLHAAIALLATSKPPHHFDPSK